MNDDQNMLNSLRQQLQETQTERDHLHQQLQEMQSSRAWRVLTAYYRLRNRVRRALGLGQSRTRLNTEEPKPSLSPLPADLNTFMQTLPHTPDGLTFVMDWHTDLNLAEHFPQYRVFQPPLNDNDRLPYADHSVDVVVFRDGDATRHEEAARLATVATVCLPESDTVPVEIIEQETSELAATRWKPPITRPSTTHGRAILVCFGYPIPFDRGGSYMRGYNLVRHLYGLGYAVTLYFRVMDEMRQYHIDGLLEMATALYTPDHNFMCDDVTLASLEQVLTDTDYSCALVFAAWLSLNEIATIHRVSPRCAVIVDTVDLKLLKLVRSTHTEAQQSGIDSKIKPADSENIIAELNSLIMADVVLTVSPKEADYVDDLVGENNHAVVVRDEAFYPDRSESFEKRSGFLLLGYYKYPPNLQALTFVLDHVLPHIPLTVLEQHPFQVIGGGLPDTVQRRLAKTPGVQYIGWVPHIEPYLLMARVSVVPILVGAGTKNKLIQAMGAGLPTVTTTMGAEGIELAPNEAFIVENNPATFAAQVVRLLQEKALWLSLSQRGRDYVRQHHTPQVMRDSVAAALDLAKSRITPKND